MRAENLHFEMRGLAGMQINPSIRKILLLPKPGVFDAGQWKPEAAGVEKEIGFRQ